MKTKSEFMRLSEELEAAAGRMVSAPTEEEFNRLYEEYNRLETMWMREWKAYVEGYTTEGEEAVG